MKNLKNCPELMTRIINIQMMREKIIPGYDKETDFKTLEKLSDDKLWDLQNSLIPKYNKVVIKEKIKTKN